MQLICQRIVLYFDLVEVKELSANTLTTEAKMFERESKSHQAIRIDKWCS